MNNITIKAGHEVLVSVIPDCDICIYVDLAEVPNKASHDGRTSTGQWANMCKSHFRDYGVGTGVGYGQKLILDTDEYN